MSAALDETSSTPVGGGHRRSRSTPVFRRRGIHDNDGAVKSTPGLQAVRAYDDDDTAASASEDTLASSGTDHMEEEIVVPIGGFNSRIIKSVYLFVVRS